MFEGTGIAVAGRLIGLLAVVVVVWALTSFVAGVGGFRGRDYFEAAGGERGPVQVRF
jgi:hypothetical protein